MNLTGVLAGPSPEAGPWNPDHAESLEQAGRAQSGPDEPELVTLASERGRPVEDRRTRRSGERS